MGKNLVVNVDGFGKFKVKMPKVYTKETVEQTVMDAVLQTLNMMTEAKSKDHFHPALGVKKRDEV